MAAVDPASTPFTLTCRWAGRICSGVLCLLIVSQILGANLPVNFKVPPTDTLQQVAFLVALMGMAVGWLWEGLGALMIFGGMTAYSYLYYTATGIPPAAPNFFFWVPGMLYLSAAALSSRTKVAAA